MQGGRHIHSVAFMHCVTCVTCREEVTPHDPEPTSSASLNNSAADAHGLTATRPVMRVGKDSGPKAHVLVSHRWVQIAGLMCSEEQSNNVIIKSEVTCRQPNLAPCLTLVCFMMPMSLCECL
jgi:hypothetical protein